MKTSIIAISSFYDEPKAFRIDAKTGQVVLLRNPEQIISKKDQMIDDFINLSGYSANVCYTNKNFEEISLEDQEKTKQRLSSTLASGHHSVCDHARITLYLDDIPKLFAMLLNNEKDYSTSEKSGRYAKIDFSKEESALAGKWNEIFKEEINKIYPQTEGYLDDKRKDKIAQENARYLISVLLPNTKMVHTLSLRQLNYEYNWMQKILQSEDNPKYYELLKPTMQEFCSQIEELGLVMSGFQENKNRSFSLVDNSPKEEIFSNIYQTTYSGSLTAFAQGLRHRSLRYSMSEKDEFEIFVPPILKSDKNLEEEWREDALKVADKIPQGTMVDITESGTYEAFKWKMFERKCARAQMEIREQTAQTAQKYYEELSKKQNALADDLKNYLKGSRCSFPDYKCKEPCGFKDGILGISKI